MGVVQRKLTKTFNAFFDSEKSGGVVLIACTIVSLLTTNSVIGTNYLTLWHLNVGGLSVEQWINDGLMAIFFLLIGLELKRELYEGELSDIKNALLPIFAAIGGVVLPAIIHFALNNGTPTQPGIGIPLATDIAFALGVLALLGSRVPASLKVFLTALAVMDDLAAIIVIAIFYTSKLATIYLFGAIVVFGILFLLKKARVMSLLPYLLGGVLMWVLMLKSGVHATIAGVWLAFAIPFTGVAEDDETSPSYKLEHFLHKPVAFFILPVFALANTGIIIGADWFQSLASANNIGILAGLIIGKPLGIALMSFAVTASGICSLPSDLNFKHIVGAGFLGGIGFTMSIFITNLAFTDSHIINNAKIAILLASLTAGTVGFIWLKVFGKPEEIDNDTDAMDFAGNEE